MKTVSLQESSSTGTSMTDMWSPPELVDTQVHQDSIHLVYRKVSMITYTVHPAPPPEIKVYKVIYSCKDGKWHQSEEIKGVYQSARGEAYLFNH